MCGQPSRSRCRVSVMPQNVCYDRDKASRPVWPSSVSSSKTATLTRSWKATQTRTVRKAKHTWLDNQRRNAAKRLRTAKRRALIKSTDPPATKLKHSPDKAAGLHTSQSGVQQGWGCHCMSHVTHTGQFPLEHASLRAALAVLTLLPAVDCHLEPNWTWSPTGLDWSPSGLPTGAQVDCQLEPNWTGRGQPTGAHG